MHKILVPVTRESGSIAENVVVGSFPETRKTLEARSGKKKIIIAMRFYETDCLDSGTTYEIENDRTIPSDKFKSLIEQKGYKHANLLNPKTGDLMRGVNYSVSDDFLNDITTPLAIKMQYLTSEYLENIFGYWNVYEMDFEKYQQVENIGMNGVSEIELSSSFVLKKIKIEETTGLSPYTTGYSPEISRTLRLTNYEGSLYTGSTISDSGSTGSTFSGVTYAEVDLVDALNCEIDVDIIVNEDDNIYIECDEWYGQSYKITTKHSLRF